MTVMRLVQLSAFLIILPSLTSGLVIETPCLQRTIPQSFLVSNKQSTSQRPLVVRTARIPLDIKNTLADFEACNAPKKSSCIKERGSLLRVASSLKKAPILRALLPTFVAVLFLSSIGVQGATAAMGGEINCIAGAASFFNGMRTPAALVAGAAIGSMWNTFGDPKNATHAKLQALYSMLLCCSVVLQFSTVFFATSSDVKLLYGSFKSPMAKDVVTFLTREMELPYVAVRLHFFLGIICFLAGLAIRSWVCFPPNVAKASVTILVAMIANMFCMIDRGLISFLGLTARFLYLFITSYWKQPLGLLSMVLYTTSVYFIFNELFLEKKGGQSLLSIPKDLFGNKSPSRGRNRDK